MSKLHDAAPWWSHPEVADVLADRSSYLAEAAERTDRAMAAAKHLPCRWRTDRTCPHPAKCRYGYECEARPTAAREGLEPIAIDLQACEDWLATAEAREPWFNDAQEG